MKISVGWITRKRCTQFVYSVCSFVQNANNPQNLELLFSIDEDDKDTLDAIKQMYPFLNISGVEVLTLVNERYGYDHMDKYHRNAGKNFTGDCLICPSDDVFCITNGWDDILKEAVEPYLDELPFDSVDSFINYIAVNNYKDEESWRHIPNILFGNVPNPKYSEDRR